MSKGTEPTAEIIIPPTVRLTKKDQLVALLQRSSGATLAELTAELSWLPHTVRAALSGLRKGGKAVERSTAADGATVYRIPAGH